MKCKACNGTGQVPDEQPQRRQGNEYRNVPDGFAETCRSLKKTPDLDRNFRDFLDKMLVRTTISEKQYGFFSAIHKETTGNWPQYYFKSLKRPGQEEKSFASPRNDPMPDREDFKPADDDDIPF